MDVGQANCIRATGGAAAVRALSVSSFAPGSYEVTDFKRAFGANTLQAATSSEAIGNEMETTWDRIKQLNTVQTKEVRTLPSGIMIRAILCRLQGFGLGTSRHSRVSRVSRVFKSRVYRSLSSL